MATAPKLAAAAPNFGSILDESPNEVTRPPSFPVGSYLSVVKGQPSYDKSPKKQTEFVEFQLQPLRALDDVDPADLEAFGSLENRTIRARYYLTEDSIYRLDEFHQHCGLDLSEDASRRERNERCVNCQVIAVIKHSPRQDGQGIYAELARTALAE